ncbi:MAG: isochorismatase family protein [Armatimonadetes bacterium]|nr:isochorismatase family protein [Armatimonadota bacterium]
MGRIWDDVISQEEQEIYERAGYGRPAGFGQRPAVLLVDLYHTDPKRAAGQDSRFRDPPPPGHDLSIKAIQTLLAAARERGLPIFYSTNQYRADGKDIVGWSHKSWRAGAHSKTLEGQPYPFIEAVAPQPEDWVICKQAPSVFFGTQLATYLIKLGVDTLLVGGQTTSGCVRATVLDAFSYGFRTTVVEECTYDRCRTSHKVNLFDMHQKYADVVPLAEVLEYLKALALSAVAPARSR